jgi:hypothetical protein
MTTTNLGRRILAAAGGLATAAVLVAAPAPATAASAEPVPICPSGNVCLAPTDGGPVVLVPAGESQEFDPALKVDWIANSTKLNYCIGGDFSFGLPPGELSDMDQFVELVVPGEFCASGSQPAGADVAWWHIQPAGADGHPWNDRPAGTDGNPWND